MQRSATGVVGHWYDEVHHWCSRPLMQSATDAVGHWCSRLLVQSATDAVGHWCSRPRAAVRAWHHLGEARLAGGPGQVLRATLVFSGLQLLTSSHLSEALVARWG